LLTNKGPFVSITHTLTLAAYEHFLTNHRKYPKVSSQLSKYIYLYVLQSLCKYKHKSCDFGSNIPTGKQRIQAGMRMLPVPG